MKPSADKPEGPSDIKRITKRRAIAILLETAQSHLRGAGCGLAEIPNERRKQLVRAAARKVWRDAYHFDFPEAWPR